MRRSEGGNTKPLSFGREISLQEAHTVEDFYPSRFEPPQNGEDTPQALFENEHRFIRRTNPREILIYTAGTCPGNGHSSPRAGYAFVYRPSAYLEDGTRTHFGTIAYRLEARGPSCRKIHTPTSNRAELRAMVAALQFRNWSTDCNGGWRTLVIATDSEYVANGVTCTEWIKGWEAEKWTFCDRHTQPESSIKNQDPWRLLIRLIRDLHGSGLHVSFWRIPRAYNERANLFAKGGADVDEVPDFMKIQYAGPKSSIMIPIMYDKPLLGLRRTEDITGISV
ncbi:Uu.00g128480.m01.CDS01 [Anthostomella pinea]|uniref:Uu.00g128480.m01.CDS01 n=1 Tax=Anthostomella pinea TaxID=933095 RepID=A0AAI8VJF4_9PEZI|nr:Uu.00g128480.m01.CDS01 [Anthostomella pinea]